MLLLQFMLSQFPYHHPNVHGECECNFTILEVFLCNTRNVTMTWYGDCAVCRYLRFLSALIQCEAFVY